MHKSVRQQNIEWGSVTCTITLAGDHGEKAQEIKNECGRFLWPCSSGISLT